MKWLKKWSYLLLLAGMGIFYLSCVDEWQVYAKPLQEVKNWYDSVRQTDAIPVSGEKEEDGDVVEGETISPEGDVEGAEAADHPESEGAAEGDTVPDLPGTGGSAEGGEGAVNSPAEGTENTGNPSAEGAEGAGEAPGNEGGSQPEGEAEPVLPVYTTVEDDYFADAVFIGDSRTVGLFEYAGLEETAAFYASTGLTVYKMFDAEIVSVPGERKKITVEEALQQNTFAKIYLMIGINEMGTGTVESFLEKYREAVAHLQELQPDAIIYVQAIIKVTTERSNQGDYINNEGILARNEGIAQMADNEKIFYLDVNPLICDETGGMVPEYTFDGVHLKAKYIDIWKDYLKTHAISP